MISSDVSKLKCGYESDGYSRKCQMQIMLLSATLRLLDWNLETPRREIALLLLDVLPYWPRTLDYSLTTPGQHPGPKLRDTPFSAFRKRPALVFFDLFPLFSALLKHQRQSISPPPHAFSLVGPYESILEPKLTRAHWRIIRQSSSPLVSSQTSRCPTHAPTAKLLRPTVIVLPPLITICHCVRKATWLEHRTPDRKAWVGYPMPPNNLRVHVEYVLVKLVGPKVLWVESGSILQGTGEYFPPLQFYV
ncbi:uncharacterized protein TNCV_1034061 [Trichonephila clavipes]|nr:uncharacterized protein TNCV_1034061 [Trichonephila clavipes]